MKPSEDEPHRLPGNPALLMAAGVIAIVIALPLFALGSDSENAHATRATLIGAAVLAVGVTLGLWGLIVALRRK